MHEERKKERNKERKKEKETHCMIYPKKGKTELYK